MNKRIAIFHGTCGAPSGNWFPWLKNNLEQRGDTVYVPTLPTPEGQHVDAWIDAVQQQIPNIQAVDVIIGHSCGATFIPHLIDRLNLAPRQIILASAFSGALGLPDYDVLNQTFFLDEALLQKVQQKNIPTVQFHGDHDPYVPLDQARYIARLLNTNLRVIPNGGHLNAEFGYVTFPDILDVIDL